MEIIRFSFFFRRTGLFIGVFLVLSSFATSAPEKFEDLLNNWDTFLKQHVDQNGNFDYAELKKDPSQLETIYGWVAQHSPDSHPELFSNEAARFSYWLNAYNIASIRGVIRHYPITSVRDVKKFSLYSIFKGGGFFAAQKFKFGEKKMSLHHLENKVIRKRFKDPRLHFALNCTSVGCPVLPPEAFQPLNLEIQLEREARLFVNNPRNFKVNNYAAKIELSSIFDWYRDDFTKHASGEPEKSLLDYIHGYLNPEKQAALIHAREQGYRITYTPYDWSLNDRLEN